MEISYLLICSTVYVSVPCKYNGNCTEYPTSGIPNDQNTQQKSWVFWSLGIAGKMTGIPNNGMPNDGMPNSGMSSVTVRNTQHREYPTAGIPNDGMPNDGIPNNRIPNNGMSSNHIRYNM